MKIGIANTIISPDREDRKRPIQLGGFSPREYCSGIHDDLFARCVYFEGNKEDISTHIMFMVCDIIAIDKRIAKLVKEKIARKIPILEQNIMISATHTHHGPDYKGNFKVGGGLSIIQGFLFPNPQTDLLVELGKKMIKVGIKAYSNRERSALGVKQIKIPENRRVMINRRAPFNPESADYPVTIIRINRIRNEDQQNIESQGEVQKNGEMIGCIVNYAIHGTVLPRYNTEITADYVGYLIRRLEDEYPDLTGKFLYFNGPCGEINPLTSELKQKMEKAGSLENLTNDDIYDQKGTWDDAKRIGNTIAEEVISHLDNISCKEFANLTCKKKTVHIPIKDYTQAHDFGSVLNHISYQLKKNLFSFFARINLLKTSILLSTETIQKGFIEAPLQWFQIGYLMVFSVPGEYFLKLAKEVLEETSRKFPDKKGMIVELANDSVGYLYSLEAYIEGGYESSFSLTPLGGRYITLMLKKGIRELKQAKTEKN